MTIALAEAIAARISGVGWALSIPRSRVFWIGPVGAVADHELLKRHPVRAALHPRAHGLVGHRQHARRDPERRPELGERVGQARALGEPPRALDPDRQVAVAELKPDVDAERAQAVHDRERVVAQAPAALVDDVGEPEHDEVGVRADVGAVDLDVVGRVGDHRQLRAGDVEHPARELRAAGAARQDHHAPAISATGQRSSGSAVIFRPARVL